MTTAAHARLDAVMVERGIADSRERARALIAAGLVVVEGQRGRDAAQAVGPADDVRIAGREHPWASRGGLKLAAALDAFGVVVHHQVCLDAGASTGGFTDVLLSRGATMVYAVDVGQGQLVQRLATDERVRVMDRTNLRLLEELDGPAPSVVTLDLSFISLRAVLPPLGRLAPAATVVALFKPQFELPRGAVARGGVVRDTDAVSAGLADFARWARTEVGAESLSDPVPASVRGAKGNQEWLLHLRLANGA